MSLRTTNAPQRLRAKLLLWGLILTTTPLGGCDAKPDGEGESEPEAQIGGVSQIVTVPDPNGSYFAEVLANGTGCPPGTWNTSISSDGLAFTTTFSNYVTEVNPSVALSVRDCQLAIKLHTPNGRSFSVQTFSYTGYALLQPGVTGRQMANYYFQGTPVPAAESNRTDLVGPYDKAYLFRDDIPIEARTWSPCGVERELNIMTRVQLQNGEKRAGYMNLSAADGSGKLVVKLDSRACPLTTGPQDTAPVAPAKPTQVALSPASVQPGQAFTVTWEPLANRPAATYNVQVRSGASVLWESPAIAGRGLSYNGPSLRAGSYQVVVVVRDGSLQAASDPVSLTVGAPAASLPPWAMPLVGRYAMRIESYSTNSLGLMTTNQAVSLAEIVVENGALEFRERNCSQTSQALGVSLALRTPEAFPFVRRKISLESGSRWSTDSEPLGVGYERDGIPACAGRAGQSIPKLPEQRWIRGNTCRCPREPSSRPTIDDCRVTDPDGDGFPGLAYKFGSLSSSEGSVSHSSTVSRTHFVGGRVDPNGAHSASVKIDEVSYQLMCEPSGCGLSFDSWPCTSDYNTVRFVRLPEPPAGQSEWTCGSMTANLSRFFPRPIPSAPRTCSRETPTDAQ